MMMRLFGEAKTLISLLWMHRLIQVQKNLLRSNKGTLFRALRAIYMLTTSPTIKRYRTKALPHKHHPLAHNLQSSVPFVPPSQTQTQTQNQTTDPAPSLTTSSTSLPSATFIGPCTKHLVVSPSPTHSEPNTRLGVKQSKANIPAKRDEVEAPSPPE